MVNASVDKNFGPLGLGIYAGLGLENSDMKLSLAADSAMSLPAFKLDIAGDNKFRFQIGPSHLASFL